MKYEKLQHVESSWYTLCISGDFYLELYIVTGKLIFYSGELATFKVLFYGQWATCRVIFYWGLAAGMIPFDGVITNTGKIVFNGGSTTGRDIFYNRKLATYYRVIYYGQCFTCRVLFYGGLAAGMIPFDGVLATCTIVFHRVLTTGSKLQVWFPLKEL